MRLVKFGLQFADTVVVTGPGVIAAVVLANSLAYIALRVVERGLPTVTFGELTFSQQFEGQRALIKVAEQAELVPTNVGANCSHKP